MPNPTILNQTIALLYETSPHLTIALLHFNPPYITLPLLYATAPHITLPLPYFTPRYETKPLLYIVLYSALLDHTTLNLTLPLLNYTLHHHTLHHPTLHGNIIFLVHILLYTKSTSTTILLSKQYSFYLTYCLYYCKSTYLSSYTHCILQ